MNSVVIFKMKKGDINWQMIMMILALIALVVLLFIFKDIIFGSKDNFDFYNTCAGKGGKEIVGANAKCEPGETQIFVTKWSEKNKDCSKVNVDCVCCIDQDDIFKKDET